MIQAYSHSDGRYGNELGLERFAVKFNRYVWDLYTQSQVGRKAVDRFSKPSGELADADLRFIEYALVDPLGEQTGEILKVDIAEFIRGHAEDTRIQSQEDARRFLAEMYARGGFSVDFDETGRAVEDGTNFGAFDDEWYNFVNAISVGLYEAHPEFFLPYAFRCRFNLLEEIHGEFGIPLPPIPGKADKQGRALYYSSINEEWHEFRRRHQMSPAEMVAFLYDFSSAFTTPLDASDLPSPSKVWLVSGGAGGAADFNFVDSATEATNSRWAGNVGVRRGDILLMYLVSPRCCIDSIWRASSDAFIDPFFHYHSQIWLCAPIRTKPIDFAELKQHPLLSQKSAVKGNFQGPNSRAPFTLEEYEAILEMMNQKGQDLSMIPRIPIQSYSPGIELLNERDVEVQLIEPLLKRLGYADSDWIRQMPVKMGRGERNYPDYAIGATAKRGEESAKMICESKFQLSAHREFADAFYQAKSYALRLRCSIMMTAAKEGIWVFPPIGGTFEIKNFVHRTWNELCHPDAFHEVLSLIGKGQVLGRRPHRV